MIKGNCAQSVVPRYGEKFNSFGLLRCPYWSIVKIWLLFYWEICRPFFWNASVLRIFVPGFEEDRPKDSGWVPFPRVEGNRRRLHAGYLQTADCAVQTMQTVQTTQTVQTRIFFFEINLLLFSFFTLVCWRCVYIYFLLLAMPVGACKPGMVLKKVYNQFPSS